MIDGGLGVFDNLRVRHFMGFWNMRLGDVLWVVNVQPTSRDGDDQSTISGQI